MKKFFTTLLCFVALISYAQTYQLHQKVKVKWGGTWWDAEIIDINNDQYRIHYDNYGSNWDEWVKTDRLQSKAGPANADAKEKVASPGDGKYSVGEKIEAWSAGKWYPASIVSIGSGNYKGYYYVHFTEYSDASNQWLNATSVRKTKTQVLANAAPRDGKYRMLSYGSPPNPIYLGYFTLKSGNYAYYSAGNQLLGSGTYSFNKASSMVQWNSGPFKTSGWGGAFEISREGKTHTIRLHGVTIGTNSTDAP